MTGAVVALYIRARYGSGAAPEWRSALVRWWHARLCRALGVRLEVQGSLAPRCLLVGNHISWLDIPAIGAQAEIGFLSKAEVRKWPLIGWMAAVAGTCFIERGGNQSDQVLENLRTELAQGRAIMIFPEGTTTDGRAVKRFHPRLLAAAQGAGADLQPIAISYHKGTDPRPDQDVPYIGEDTLIANLWRLMRHPALVARIRFLPPIRHREGEQRRVLAERARAAVLAALDLPPEPQCVSTKEPPLAAKQTRRNAPQPDPNPARAS